MDSLLATYRDKLSAPCLPADIRPRGRQQPAPRTDDGLPATGFKLDESDSGTANRIDVSIREISRLKTYNPSLASTYEHFKTRVETDGRATVKAIIQQDHRFLARQPGASELLEVIARTDGSRPAVAIKNGRLDLSSSPIGEWAPVLDKSVAALEKAFRSVGRIEQNGVHIGTGFLISPMLVLTNRHVLQCISFQEDAFEIEIKPGATIDFGREYRGIASVAPHRIRSVAFCTGEEITAVNHKQLDIALLEVEPVRSANPLPVLGLSRGPSSLDPHNTIVYVVGYPGMPNLTTYPMDIVDLLFGTAFGCKRLSPGKVVEGCDTEPWTVAHDATTTAGSSGSVILVRTQEGIAAGIHYGGSADAPRQNWGHILQETLDTELENIASGRPLLDCLAAGGVVLA